ncbi:MAG TPA: hypothetical protein VHS09_16475 [Polyangiaceae bacterium]|jgi:hypothetical protein|nr:hypothetical protein [Polyangiaceae bacterium]
MRRPEWLLLPLLLGGCSSTGKVVPLVELDAGGDYLQKCFESTAPNQGCIDCVETACVPPLEGLLGPCAALLQCECPGGYHSATAGASCSTQAKQGDCPAATSTFAACEAKSCSTECAASSPLTTGSGSGG